MRRKRKKSALVAHEVGAGVEIVSHRTEADCAPVAPVRCKSDFTPDGLELGESAIDASGPIAARQLRFSAELVRDAQTYLETRLNRKVPDDEVAIILARLMEFGKVLRSWRP